MFGKKFFSTVALSGAAVSFVGSLGGSAFSTERRTKEDVLRLFDDLLDVFSNSKKLGETCSEETLDKVVKMEEYIKALRCDLLNDNYRYMKDSHCPDAVEKESDFIYFPNNNGKLVPVAMILGKCDFLGGQACEESKVLEYIEKREDGGFNRLYIWFD